MLCDGICKTKKARCGLLESLAQFRNGAKVEGSEYDLCVFRAVYQKLCEHQTDHIRIQAAIESSRNQKASDDLNANQTIAQGFVAIVAALKEEPDKTQKMLRGLLNTALKLEKQKERLAEDAKKLNDGLLPTHGV